MFHIKSVAAAVSASLVLSASPAVSNDLASTDTVLCTLKRLGDCKADGQCLWKAASERQAQRQLKVDFKDKKATFVDPKGVRPMGVIVKDALKEGVRHFSIARRAQDDAKTHLTVTLDKAGKLRMTQRSLDPKAPAMVIEAACVKG